MVSCLLVFIFSGNVNCVTGSSNSGSSFAAGCMSVWGISCLVLLPSPCNDSACTYHSAIFVKPQQWLTPSESIAIYCVRKLVSCVTHLQSCAKVDIWNKKEKLRTVAKTKTQDYKNWRLQNLSIIATPPLNAATTLFNEHRSQRPFGASDWQTHSPRLAWFLSQTITWFATDRNVQRKTSSMPTLVSSIAAGCFPVR